MRPVIISCAVTGSGDTAHLSPHVPVTPAQIASECLAARETGAAVTHIHVRNPETGKPSRDLALYQDVVQRIRAAGSDLLINLTTGPGARFIPGANDPGQGAPGTTMATPEDRVAHVLDLRPDICSLDVATLNFGPHAMVNVPAHLETMARMIRAAGVKPELEVFDLGHVALAARMVQQGAFQDPPFLQLCLGIQWGAPATTESMLAMRGMLPAGCVWSAFGISRHQFPMAGQAAIMGGHVRVGLEDNLYLAKGQLAPGNASLVERAATIIRALGYEVATPGQTRELLGV